MKTKSKKQPKKKAPLNSFAFTDWKMLANKMYWKWYSVWWEKYRSKEITNEELRAGFNIQLDEIDLTTN